MSHYEIEIKSLLGERKNAEALKSTMCERDPACACVSQHKQLNHYFKDGDITELFEAVKQFFSGETLKKLERTIEKGEQFSIRSRQKDDEVLLVVKASMDEGTSENTISRMEFEEPVPVSLEELDRRILDAGFVYQAKWSREREEYSYKGANVCIDRNAGYGYLAEFEKMTDDEEEIGAVRKELEAMMAELGVEELPQDRLARMFDHYNENWSAYYGTDKTFTLE